MTQEERWTNQPTDTHKQPCIQIRQTDKCSDAERDRHTDRRANRWTNRQTDRQAGREVHTDRLMKTDRDICKLETDSRHQVPELGPVNLGIGYEHGDSGSLAGLGGSISLVQSLLLRPYPLHQCIKLLVWPSRTAHDIITSCAAGALWTGHCIKQTCISILPACGVEAKKYWSVRHCGTGEAVCHG